jgi:hypothetical protein
MTDTNILDGIPVRDKDKLLDGCVGTYWLPASVERRVRMLKADSDRNQHATPRFTDFYRACFKEGVKILSEMDAAEIQAIDKNWETDPNWSEECRKTPCGFDESDNLALFVIGQQTNIKRDSRLRRIAVKLGCDSLFGE